MIVLEVCFGIFRDIGIEARGVEVELYNGYSEKREPPGIDCSNLRFYC